MNCFKVLNITVLEGFILSLLRRS